MFDIHTPLSILGGMTADTFLNEYWQKKPLLIRAGLTDFEVPLDANELAGIAMEEEVESRIVIEKGNTPWQLLQGPFSEDTYANLPAQEWTLLVQAVDHWMPEVQALKERFQFLPSWRLDDVMISYATTGGSVGPHYDQYDVFLVQVAGKRRWQVLAPEDYQDSAIAGIDLHILDNFNAKSDMDWTLEEGDILYLPPNYAHNGRAVNDDCMTYSIGFRAPSLQAALTGVRDKLCEQINEKQRFAAPETEKREHNAEIHADDIAYLQKQLSQMLEQPDLLAEWLGQTMSESKYPEYLSPLNKAEVNHAFQQAIRGHTFIRPGDARICYYQQHINPEQITVFCNGEYIVVEKELISFVQAICDQSEFDFSGLDLNLHSDLTPLMRFFISQQGLIEVTANETDEDTE